MIFLALVEMQNATIAESVGSSTFELIGVLLFGIALFVTAMFIRRASNRAAAIEREKEITK